MLGLITLPAECPCFSLWVCGFFCLTKRVKNAILFLSVLSSATLLTILLEGFDIMFFRRTREELAKLKEERKQFKAEKDEFEKEKEQFEELKKSVEAQNSKPDNESPAKPSVSKNVEPNK